MSDLDLALTESRTLREQHMDRTDVLDKVGVLALLPDDMHATTEMVATYYEVPIKTVEAAVSLHRAELKSDGHDVLDGERLTLLKQVCQIQSRTRSLALFPRRAILRMGMLLTESDIARQVRDHLLNKEAESRTAVERIDFAALDINDPNMVLILAQAAQRSALQVIEERNGRVAAEAQIAVLEPKAATLDAIEAGKGMAPKVYRKSYFPDVPQSEFFNHLYRRGFLIDQRGRGSWDARNERHRDGWEHGHPGAAGKDFFYLHSELDRYEVRRYHARVRPGDPEIKLRDLLIRQGLTPKLITDADLERNTR